MGENEGELGSVLDKVKKEKKKKEDKDKIKEQLLGNLGSLAAMAGGLAKDGGLDGILNNLGGPLAALAGGLGKDGGVNDILGTLGSALGNAKKNKENKGEKNKESDDGMMNEKEGKESEGGLGGFNDILGNLGSVLDKE